MMSVEIGNELATLSKEREDIIRDMGVANKIVNRLKPGSMKDVTPGCVPDSIPTIAVQVYICPVMVQPKLMPCPSPCPSISLVNENVLANENVMVSVFGP